jgi:hypothetical protein
MAAYRPSEEPGAEPTPAVLTPEEVAVLSAKQAH